jgi:glutamate-5-semialdehyde dehydrogenase
MNVAQTTRTPGTASTAAEPADLAAAMADIGRRARGAVRVLGMTSTEAKNAALNAMAAAIRRAESAILAANAEDVAAAKATGVTGSFIDRLTLTPARVAAMAEGIGTIAALADPVGR